MKLLSYGNLLGKITEYACCISLNTPFQGAYTGPLPPVYHLASRFSQNKLFLDEFNGFQHAGHLCPYRNIYHPPYDFIHSQNHDLGLSVKSIASNNLAKISPSTIGQPSSQKFCDIFGFDYGDEYFLKYQIQSNINQMLPLYFQHTFSYPMLYFHAKKDIVLLIRMKDNIPIPWYDYKILFTHETKQKLWKESSSIYVDHSKGPSKSLGEFQFHRHRNCIKFRFSLTNLLAEFPEYFHIQKW